MASTQKRMSRSAQNWPMRARSWRWPLANSTWERVTSRVFGSAAACEDFFDGDMSRTIRTGFFFDHHQLHPALLRQVHPGVDVGGVFDVCRDDAVAKLPVDALGDDADSLAGVLDKGDFVAMAADEGSGFLPELFDVLIPPRFQISGRFGLVRESPQGVAGRARQRRRPRHG